MGGAVYINVDVTQNDYFAWVGLKVGESFGETRRANHGVGLQTFKGQMFKGTCSMF